MLWARFLPLTSPTVQDHSCGVDDYKMPRKAAHILLCARLQLLSNLSVAQEKGFQVTLGQLHKTTIVSECQVHHQGKTIPPKHTKRNMGFSFVPQHGTQEDTFRVWWAEINPTVKPSENWTSVWAVNSLKKKKKFRIYLQTFQSLYIVRVEIQERGYQSGDYVNGVKSEEKYIHQFKMQASIWNSVSSSLSLPCFNSRPSDCPLQGFHAMSDHNCF